MSKSKFLFIMTGSIACYKACQVISRLVQQGHEVQVVATAAALQFVGAATLEGLSGHQVVSDLYGPGNMMDHIHLMRWADVIVVAPATANYINKISQGVGDDLATTLFLAHDFKKPFFLAPAMNTSMYEHPVTSENLQRLRAMGLNILDSGSGMLACGESGQGRLLDPDLILTAITSSPVTVGKSSSESSQVLKVAPVKPMHVLVTAGGTFELLDGVRGIGNISTGSTGARLAELLSDFGFEVTLLRAESAKTPRTSFAIHQETFTSFQSLEMKLKELLTEQSFDAVIHAAAVSDFSVDTLEVNGVTQAPGKLKLGSSDALTVRFKNNPKLVDQIKSLSKQSDLTLVAFKLTSQASLAERDQAVAKLKSHAPADLVVQNDMSEIDKSKNQHLFTIYQNEQKTAVNGVEALASELAQFLVRSKK